MEPSIEAITTQATNCVENLEFPAITLMCFTQLRKSTVKSLKIKRTGWKLRGF
jgi:hypothetical protein